jgi:ribonuclease Z
MIELILLGTSGTVPLPDRPLSSLLARVGPELILFDCGEGTQVSMRRAGWGFKGLSAICVSHLHADHIAGLPGLLLSVANAGRTAPFDIYGPVGSRIVVAGLRVVAPYLPYEVRVHEMGATEGIHWNGARLATLLLDHAVPCLAFRLDVGRGRPFQPDKARALGVPVEDWKPLQQGRTVVVDGRTVAPDEVLGDARRGLRFAYVTDTRPTPELPGFVKAADLLVIEGTYGDPADAANAVENKHLIFAEAAEIGRRAQVRQMWLTHFSAKLTEPERFAAEAQRILPSTTVGHEGLRASLRFDDAEANAPTSDAPDEPGSAGDGLGHSGDRAVRAGC